MSRAKVGGLTGMDYENFLKLILRSFLRFRDPIYSTVLYDTETQQFDDIFFY